MLRYLILVSLPIVMLFPSLQLQAQEFDLPSVEPAACTIEPEQVLLPSEAGDLNASSPTPTPIEAGNAVPADRETAVAVIDRIAQSIACQNAGDLPRMIANFSSSWIADRFSGYDLVFMPRYFEAADSPGPLPESERIELVEIENIVVRHDGVVLATVTTSVNGAIQQSLLALILENGAWVIESGQILVTR
jgi:hypothetical protein